MNRKLKAKIIEVFGTQGDFARELGIDESVISRVIRGRRLIRPEEAKKWAEVLGLNQDELIR